MHLRKPGFIYSACEPFIKHKERTQKLKKKQRFKIYLSKRSR